MSWKRKTLAFIGDLALAFISILTIIFGLSAVEVLL